MGDENGGFHPTAPPGDTTTTTTTSGGGSSGPARDVYVSDLFDNDAIKRQKATTFAQIYAQIWDGEPATEEYLINAVNSGLNSVEFATQEKRKPEWVTTKAFKDAYSARAAMLNQLGV